MIEYFVGTLKDCKDLVAKLDTLLGYPNIDTKTETYAVPMKHETFPGVFFIPMKDTYSPAKNRETPLAEMSSVMSGKELTWKTETLMRVEGAFPAYMGSVRT